MSLAHGCIVFVHVHESAYLLRWAAIGLCRWLILATGVVLRIVSIVLLRVVLLGLLSLKSPLLDDIVLTFDELVFEERQNSHGSLRDDRPSNALERVTLDTDGRQLLVPAKQVR